MKPKKKFKVRQRVKRHMANKGKQLFKETKKREKRKDHELLKGKKKED